jgi:hypothetical protein
MSVAGDEPLSPAGVPPVGTRDGAAWPADPWLVDSWLVEAPSDEERAIAAGAAAERGAEFAAMGDDDLDCYLAELDHRTDSHAHEAAPRSPETVCPFCGSSRSIRRRCPHRSTG